MMFVILAVACVGLVHGALDSSETYSSGSCFCVENGRSNINVRDAPNLAGTSVGQAQQNECYKFLGGKSAADGYTWYEIDFEHNGGSAYSVGNFYDYKGVYPCCGSDDHKLTDDEASDMLSTEGISTVSSGGCSNRYNPTCTSLEQVRCRNIIHVIWLKQQSGCDITVTGGTETGHATGTYSHWNGYKLDIRMSDPCVTNYIKAFGESYPRNYFDSKTNRYYDESHHWDITFKDHQI